jgi:hypothetical protein
MVFLGFLGVTEGMEVLLISLALIIAFLFLARYVSFYLRYRRIRRENMELARHMKKQLKSAKLRPLDEILEEQEDEMFRGPPVRAKAPVIPASYEARLNKVRRKAAKRRARQAGRKRRKPVRSRKARKR